MKFHLEWSGNLLFLCRLASHRGSRKKFCMKNENMTDGDGGNADMLRVRTAVGVTVASHIVTKSISLVHDSDS